MKPWADTRTKISPDTKLRESEAALTPGRVSKSAQRRYESGIGPTDAELNLSQARGLARWNSKHPSR